VIEGVEILQYIICSVASNRPADLALLAFLPKNTERSLRRFAILGVPRWVKANWAIGVGAAFEPARLGIEGIFGFRASVAGESALDGSIEAAGT